MSYDAIYAATRNAIGHPDLSGVFERVTREALDVSWQKARIDEAIGLVMNELTRPCVRMRPALSIDGDQWCALYGSDLMNGVAGFGDTPDAACWAFDKAWTTQKAKEEGK